MISNSDAMQKFGYFIPGNRFQLFILSQPLHIKNSQKQKTLNWCLYWIMNWQNTNGFHEKVIGNLISLTDHF